MNKIDNYVIFSDVSSNPQRKLGVGGFLINRYQDNNFSENFTEDEIENKIVLKRFFETTSTKLEIQILLTALEVFQKEKELLQPFKLILVTDSQCICGLLNRRERLEHSAFLAKRSDKVLENRELYLKFYEYFDLLNFEICKIKGHTKPSLRNSRDEIFSLLDKRVRKGLRMWLDEL